MSYTNNIKRFCIETIYSLDKIALNKDLHSEKWSLTVFCSKFLGHPVSEA